MKQNRRKFSGHFKAHVAIEALKERESLDELSKQYEAHPNMISKWKQEYVERAEEIFETKAPDQQSQLDIEKLYSKIGQLEMETFKKSFEEIRPMRADRSVQVR